MKTWCSFFKNYTTDGHWNLNGFATQMKTQMRATRLQMGLIDLQEWNCHDLVTFAKILDVIVTTTNGTRPVKADYIRTLQQPHAEAQRMLFKDDQKLLIEEQQKWREKTKANWKNVPTARLKMQCKCMGLLPSEYKDHKTMTHTLTQLFKSRKRKQSQKHDSTQAKKRRRRK
jgi:hypothetical protein